MSSRPTEGDPLPGDSLRGDSPAAQLAAREMLIVTGKGGVGKSAITATLGRCLAGADRQVLLLEVDPRENLHEMLGTAPSDGKIIPVDEHLHLQNLKPDRVLDEVVREQIGVATISRRVLRSPIYRHFADSAPGLRELAILGYAWRRLRGYGQTDALRRPDLVILDAPATGHGLSLLLAPGKVEGVIPSGPFGEMASELASFVADPRSIGVVVVTQAEEMPVQETLEFTQALQDGLQRSPELLIINALYPPLPQPRDSDHPLLRLWQQRRDINDRSLARLDASWSGPRCRLPMFPEERGPGLIQRLKDSLLPQLEEGSR